MAGGGTNPRETRSSVIIRAVVHLPGDKQAERRIRNLSAKGGCMDHAADLAPGDDISLDMGALTGLDAKVMWVRDGVAGISFAAPIDLSAARKPRGTIVPITAGWLANVKDAYR
jgi:hypothetical protein